jgi:hypothetical protein
MWCALCLRTVDGVNHRDCMEEIWHTASTEYTQAREAAKKQYDFVPKGDTVEVRPPLTRSVSASDLNPRSAK